MQLKVKVKYAANAKVKQMLNNTHKILRATKITQLLNWPIINHNSLSSFSGQNHNLLYKATDSKAWRSLINDYILRGPKEGTTDKVIIFLADNPFSSLLFGQGLLFPDSQQTNHLQESFIPQVLPGIVCRQLQGLQQFDFETPKSQTSLCSREDVPQRARVSRITLP